MKVLHISEVKLNIKGTVWTIFYGLKNLMLEIETYGTSLCTELRVLLKVSRVHLGMTILSWDPPLAILCEECDCDDTVSRERSFNAS